MKISKLFHWLYACLLLLPIACFLPNAFYYGFNAQAQASERIEQQPVYYESNEVTAYNDIHLDNIYEYNGGFTTTTSYYWVAILNKDLAINQFGSLLNIREQDNIYLYVGSTYKLYIYSRASTSDATGVNLEITNINFKFIIQETIYANPTAFFNDFYQYVSYTDYQFVESYIPITYTNSITDSMSVAWQQTWSNPLFSWAKDSFIALPFAYITNIFSIPVSNTFTLALSYWLSISVIWLCFDVLMYVPMLVHRWLDRSAIK